MTDVWSERAEAYRRSQTHATGEDLDLVVAWCEPAPGVNVLDVATGGGHVARRLREAGAKVVTVDAAPGMVPDVIAPADHLPFADASFDVVAHVGGRPANFCDLGGGGSAKGVVDALEVITRDPQVRSIFFNIFGGITRGDEVARGILEALDRLDMSRYPIVVRLDGTNAEEGRRLLAEAGNPNIHPESTMLDGARRAVELAK